METAKVRTDVMYAAAQKGFLNATDLADYLVRQGLPFRSAYKMVGSLVARCIAAVISSTASVPLLMRS